MTNKLDLHENRLGVYIVQHFSIFQYFVDTRAFFCNSTRMRVNKVEKTGVLESNMIS